MNEPIDTSTPWSRPRREPLTQVEYERLAYRRMTEPGNGTIHKMSLASPDYEPNRAMAPDPKSIIAKKGWRPPDSNKVDITPFDKVVVYIILACVAGIAGTVLALIKLG
jgi:hypothetical protein